MSNEDRPLWKFKQYPLSDKGVIDKWRKKCKEYDDYAENEFQTIVNTLSALKREHWSKPEYKGMVNWPGIGELRFTNSGKTPLRVFGFHDEEGMEFIMLAGATKDNNKYDPSDIRDMCLGRKKDIELGRDTPIDFDFSDGEQEQDDDDYLKALLGLE